MSTLSNRSSRSPLARFAYPVAFALASIIVVACGGSDASRDDASSQEHAATAGVAAPRASANAGPDAAAPAPARTDAGQTYRDPSPSDGGCSAPNTICGGYCVSLTNEIGHCGACGNACVGGGSACNAGQCTCTATNFGYCPAQGGCVDLVNDPNNCGACGNRVDIQNDRNNCGMCGNRCFDGESCQDGTCQ